AALMERGGRFVCRSVGRLSHETVVIVPRNIIVGYHVNDEQNRPFSSVDQSPPFVDVRFPIEAGGFDGVRFQRRVKRVLDQSKNRLVDLLLQRRFKSLVPFDESIGILRGGVTRHRRRASGYFQLSSSACADSKESLTAKRPAAKSASASAIPA
ncbi:MAG TPA: hypothetical protein VFH27_03105, partial [Longimicrobiaceae bacterium]|nr:hypothetical protein [Longimicrobiaceae bacterium]